MITKPHGYSGFLPADWVLPITAPPIRKGAVKVVNGRIERVGPAAEICPPSTAEASASRAGRGESGRGDLAPSGFRLDLGEAALLPGLVNAHAHLDVTLLRGLCEDLDFFTWIRRLAELKSQHLDKEAFRVGARWGTLEMVRAGITTVGDTSDQGVALDALLESGQRGIAYEEVFGPDTQTCPESLRILAEALADRGSRATGRVRVGVSPHASYTVSSELFQRVAELALRDALPVAVHVDESPAERSFVREGRGPFAEFLRARGIPVSPLGESSVAYLESLGFLETRPLLIHAVDAGPLEIAAMEQRGAKVVHCPKSNAKLGHGTAPLTEFLARGVTTSLGTDGMVSNNGCDLFEEARCAAYLQRVRAHQDGLNQEALTPGVLLKLMTLGGAEALGFSRETGSLEPGKLADITAVGLSAPHLQPLHDPEAALVYSATCQDVTLTMVEGRVLYHGGTWHTLSIDALRQDLRRATGELRRSLGLPDAH